MDGDERRNFFVDEMVGSFVGPMPAREFLRKFMKYNKNTPAPKGEFDFSGIHGDMAENDMYPVIVRHLISISRMFNHSSYIS